MRNANHLLAASLTGAGAGFFVVFFLAGGWILLGLAVISLILAEWRWVT